jgi:hypothetical protein
VPGEGSGYQPPAHGTNSHGQGTVGAVDLTPSDTLPLSGDTAGGTGTDQEEVIVGRPRGEQDANGQYHGHITIAALFGNEILGVDTGPGETQAGPIDPLQQQILDAACVSSGGQVCLELLKADSATTSSGSTNSFAVANASLFGQINVGLANANGNISSDSTCQTSHGDSTVATAGVGPLDVDAAESSSDSQACNTGTSSVTHSSKVVQVNGNDIPIPCESGTPDTEFTPLVIVTAVCNADDQNGVGEAVTQTTEPYGVREALSIFVLPQIPLLKATTSASESRAVAPPPSAATTPPGGTSGGGAGGQQGKKGGGGGGGAGDGADQCPGPDCPAVAAEAGPGDDNLAFTGADVLLLGLIGLGLTGAGMVLTRTAVRHRRAAV